MGNRLSCALGVLVVAMLAPVNSGAQQRVVSPTDLVGPYQVQRLADAGYRPDDRASLLLALEFAEPRVSTIAATMLAAFPGDPMVIRALQNAAFGGEDGVVVTATRSLHTLGATGWEDAASLRLLSMEDVTARLMLADTLARAGRAVGWPTIKNELDTIGSYVGLAIRYAVYFDGLTDAGGNIINTAAELEALRGRGGQRLSEYNLEEIERALVTVHARRSTSTGR